MRVALLLAVGITWLILTAQRVSLWTDDRALWADAVQQAPDKPRPWIYLGVATAQQGDSTAAWRCFLHARTLAHQRASVDTAEAVIGEAIADANLAVLAAHSGHQAEADAWITAAQSLLPADPQVQLRAGWLLGTPD